jgi:hypothetical protein
MGLAELQKLIAESKGEREHIEFKKTTGELHGGMESLCSFHTKDMHYSLADAKRRRGRTRNISHRLLEKTPSPNAVGQLEPTVQ